MLFIISGSVEYMYLSIIFLASSNHKSTYTAQINDSTLLAKRDSFFLHPDNSSHLQSIKYLSNSSFFHTSAKFFHLTRELL